MTGPMVPGRRQAEPIPEGRRRSLASEPNETTDGGAGPLPGDRDAEGFPPYLSLAGEDRDAFLSSLDIDSFDQLESDIPAELRNEYTPSIEARDEAAVVRWHKRTSSRNQTTDDLVCFLGGGLYDHFVPSTVMDLMTRGEFLTSYTPYQAEMNQGTLQGMFEYQSMISTLMGLPVTNASMYDGATAFAEAVLMAINATGRGTVYYSPTLFESWLAVLRSYADPLGWDLKALPVADGRARLPDNWGSEPPAAVCMGYPNRWGCADEVDGWADRKPDEKTVGIAGVNALAMGLLSPPGSLGLDVAVAEGQPLGLPLQFGAPQLGLFSARERFIRQMPGRLVGETRDRRGNRCYVLTLQTREQHIRRERATSNICTNHALLTLGVAVFLATVGPEQFRERSRTNFERGRTLRDAFQSHGFTVVGDPVFNEVSIQDPGLPADLNSRLAERGWMGGYRSRNRYVCAATEQRTPDEINAFVKEISHYRE